MKQGGRVALLTISTVVAVGGFIVVWTTRPEVHNEMVEVARMRQSQPLIEVEEPARLKRTVEEARQKQVDELYPYIQKKILADQEISESLLSQLNAKIDQSVEQAVNSKLKDAIASDLAVFRDEVTRKFTDERNWTDEEIQAKMEAYVPQAVDSLIPRIMPVVVSEFEANKEEYVSRLAEDLGPNMEGVAQQLFDSQREALITEAVKRALDTIEQDLDKGAYQLPQSAPQEGGTITAPLFEVRENPTLLSEDEYAEERDATRGKLIKQVLDMLDQSGSN